MGERYVHVGKVRSRSGALHAGARTPRCARPRGRRGRCTARTPRPPAPPALRTPRRRPPCSPTPTCRPSRPAHTPPPLSARSWSGSRSVRGTVRAPAVVRGSPGTRKTDLLPPRGAVSPRDHSSSAAESGRARSPSSACSPCAPALLLMRFIVRAIWSAVIPLACRAMSRVCRGVRRAARSPRRTDGPRPVRAGAEILQGGPGPR